MVRGGAASEAAGRRDEPAGWLDPLVSRLPDTPAGRAVLRLRESRPWCDAPAVVRMLDPVVVPDVRRPSDSRRFAATPEAGWPLQCYPPVRGVVPWRASGWILKLPERLLPTPGAGPPVRRRAQADEGRAARVFFAEEIVSCGAPYPFAAIDLTREGTIIQPRLGPTADPPDRRSRHGAAGDQGRDDSETGSRPGDSSVVRGGDGYAPGAPGVNEGRF